MGRYVLRRLLQMVPVVLGVTFLIYAAVYALPGDPLAGRCGDRPCPPAFVAAYTDKFNLDDPLPIQYVKYLGNVLTGDLGENIGGEKVLDQIQRTYPTTMKLALLAIVFVIVLGVGAGIVSGIRRKGLFDTSVLVVTLLLIATPVFVTGKLLQLYLGIKWDLFAVTAREGNLGQLVMPAFVLAGLSLAYAARITRTSLSEVLRADYVRTARAKGLRQRRIIGVHALRNSLIPVVTFIGADFGALLGGAIITEGIFNIDGVGGLIFKSISRQEGATLTGVVTVLVLVFLFVNLLVDLLYAVLDPRIRYE
ncbi:MAG: ABC transporter permease [Sporichthyaceae bacterium]